MNKLPNPELLDASNPEWTDAMFRKAVRVGDLPSGLQAKLRKPGRPKALVTKEQVNIRLSPDVLAAFRAGGAGWQTRIDAALRQWLAQHAA